MPPAFGPGVIFGPRTVIGPTPAQGSFSPSDLPGLVYWHDMQDAAAYALNAGAVESITNKVSGVVTTQATAAQRPTYSATGLNGFPCGDYDGAATGDQFVGTEAAVYNVFAADGPYTLFYVAQHTAPDRTDYVFSVGNSVATGDHRAWGTSLTGSGKWIAGGNTSAGVAVNVESAGNADASPNVFEWHSPGAECSLSVNGAADDPAAAAQVVGAITLVRYAVGVRSRGTTADGDHLGPIGEVLLWGRELTAPERAQVRAYLGAKWGIAVSA